MGVATATGVTRERVETVFDGMEEIVRAEMLTRHEYVTEVVKPSRAGAVCGGRRACLVGTLWLAHAPLDPGGYRVHAGRLVGAGEGPTRDRYLRDRPVLWHCYDALNGVAAEWLERLRGGQRSYTSFEAPMEELFERHYAENAVRAEQVRLAWGGPVDSGDLLRFLAEARERALGGLS